MTSTAGTLDVEHNWRQRPMRRSMASSSRTRTPAAPAAALTVGTGTGVSATTLLVDDGTVINGLALGAAAGTMTIGTAGTLDVEHNSGSAPDATLDGVKLTDKNTSTGTAAGITVGTGTGVSATTLLVDDGTVINGGMSAAAGTMTIGTAGAGCRAQLLRRHPDATLGGVQLTDKNTSTGTAAGITVSTGTGVELLRHFWLTTAR